MEPGGGRRRHQRLRGCSVGASLDSRLGSAGPSLLGSWPSLRGGGEPSMMGGGGGARAPSGLRRTCYRGGGVGSLGRVAHKLLLTTLSVSAYKTRT